MTLTEPGTHPVHPVLGCAARMASALKDVADVDPGFMGTSEKKAALLGLAMVADQLEELTLRVLGSADDVALDEGMRDAGAWLAHHGRRDRGECGRRLRLARALQGRWGGVGRGLREGAVNTGQAEVITRALDALPDRVDPGLKAKAEAHLVGQAAGFGPKALRTLGRRVLEVVAPDVVEAAEGQALDREDRDAARRTFLRLRRRGDGTTDLTGRLAESVADRLRTYLEAFTTPRKNTPGATGPGGQAPDHRRPYDQRLGQAFGSFLEAVDPARLPLHGGDATTVIVTIALKDLLARLGVALVGDQPISAAQARRLACTARIIPAVLGGDSEVLDLGRARRLFSPAQRKAMAATQHTCRAQGCDIPAAWCEAHHAGVPWAQGGGTDLPEGMLLCSFHHHRAHDHHYDMTRLPNGDVRFRRRT